MPLRSLVTVLALGITLLLPTASALTRRVPSSDQLRLLQGQQNPNFIFANLNTTGIGWSLSTGERRGVTMISPRHFLYARHFALDAGRQLRFMTQSGTFVDGTIERNVQILNDNGAPTDLLLGVLTEPIHESTGITAQPFVRDRSTLNQTTQLIAFGRNFTAGIGRPARFGTLPQGSGGFNEAEVIVWEYLLNDPNGNDDDVYVVGGDSGSGLFVNRNGRAAIVGVHGLRGRFPAEPLPVERYDNIDTLVSHAPYVAQINAELETEGFQMIDSNPESTVLTLNVSTPTRVRAGLPAEFSFTIQNPRQGLLTPARRATNVVLQHPKFSGGEVLETTDWNDFSHPTLVDGRLATLAAEGTTTVTTELTILEEGPQTFDVTVRSDQSVPVTVSVTVDVQPSFAAYVQTLPAAEQTTDGDFDFDGFTNLEEYAFGSDPDQVTPDINVGLLPTSDPDRLQFSFPWRSDASDRGLSFQLEQSGLLEDGTWSPVQNPTFTSDIGVAGFETFTFTFDRGTGEEQFYRLQVGLSEF